MKSFEEWSKGIKTDQPKMLEAMYCIYELPNLIQEAMYEVDENVIALRELNQLYSQTLSLRNKVKKGEFKGLANVIDAQHLMTSSEQMLSSLTDTIIDSTIGMESEYLQKVRPFVKKEINRRCYIISEDTYNSSIANKVYTQYVVDLGLEKDDINRFVQFAIGHYDIIDVDVSKELVLKKVKRRLTYRMVFSDASVKDAVTTAEFVMTDETEPGTLYIIMSEKHDLIRVVEVSGPVSE